MPRVLKKQDGDYVITDEKDLISKRELETRLNVSRATIQRWLRQGLPHTAFSNYIVFSFKEVKKWLNDRNYGDIEVIARLKAEQKKRRKGE